MPWRREEGGGGSGGLVGEGAREEAREEATMAFARESTESWGVYVSDEWVVIMLVGREGRVGGGGGFDRGWEKDREDGWRIGRGGVMGSGEGVKGSAVLAIVLLGGGRCSSTTPSNLG